MKFTQSEISQIKLDKLLNQAEKFINSCNDNLSRDELTPAATNELAELFQQVFNEGQGEGYQFGFEKACTLLSSQMALSKTCDAYVKKLNEKINSLQQFKVDHKSFYQSHMLTATQISDTMENLANLGGNISQLQKDLEKALTNKHVDEAIAIIESLTLITNDKK